MKTSQLRALLHLRLVRLRGQEDGKMKSELENDFGFPPGAWVWCQECNECYQVGQFQRVGQLEFCPNYPECDGGPDDAVLWSEVRKSHPTLPQVPERGQVYDIHSLMFASPQAEGGGDAV